MNDETKEDVSDLMELLETASKKEFYRLTIDHELVVRLYNYITNLQQENERLKLNHKQLKDIEKMAISNSKLIQENEILKEIINDDMTVYLKGLEDGKEKMKQCFENIYKSRCEKASEYIDKQKKKMYKSRNKIAMFILMKLESILQNGSEKKDDR